MTTLSIATRDMLHSLTWYLSARQTSLRAALSFRTPLSVIDQTDMRVHYSGYFLNLLAATDLLRETKTLSPNNFHEQLNSRFVFDGFPDGEANYLYIRELRNAVVHRGLNITSAVHVYGDFPMILAEPKIQNQKRTRTFFAFAEYLLQIITKCESVACPAILDCLQGAGIFQATIDAEAAVVDFRKAVEQSHAIPENFKSMALLAEFKPEWAIAAHISAMAKLREALVPCDTARPSAP
jgi:hypothetical protein